MFSYIDIAIFLLYIVIILFIGLKYKNRADKDLAAFFVGNRSMPWWLAGLSMVATTFAADTPLAVTELVRNNGISGNWLWWNFLIGGMLTTFFFAKLWRRSEVLTELEFIKIRYSGKEAVFLRGLKAVYIALIMNVLIIAWVNLAMISILQGFFDISYNLAFIITASMMFLAFVYSAMSGIWGVAITDAIQFFIAIGGSIVLALLVLYSDKVGGIDGLKTHIPKEAFSFFPKITLNNSTDVLSLSIGSFLAYGLFQWWASWYPGAEPGGGGYIAQRLLSTKNEKHSFLASLFFQFAHYILRPFPWIIIGLTTIILYPNLTESTYRFGYVYAMRDFLPSGLRGLVLVSFFAAYMSTISTQLNFGASILTNDFYLLFAEFKHKNLSDKTKVNIGRLFTFLLMVISLLITTQIESISGVWRFIIECGAGLGFVLIVRWYWWRINAWAEITATVVPFLVYAVMFFSGIEFPQSFFITIFSTLLVVLIVVFISKPTDDEVLRSFYEKVRPSGWWGKYSQNNGINGWLVLCWISSVLFLYSLLFSFGNLIFHFYKLSFIWFIISLFSGFVLLWGIRRTEL